MAECSGEPRLIEDVVWIRCPDCRHILNGSLHESCEYCGWLFVQDLGNVEFPSSFMAHSVFALEAVLKVLFVSSRSCRRMPLNKLSIRTCIHINDLVNILEYIIENDMFPRMYLSGDVVVFKVQVNSKRVIEVKNPIPSEVACQNVENESSLDSLHRENLLEIEMNKQMELLKSKAREKRKILERALEPAVMIGDIIVSNGDTCIACLALLDHIILPAPIAIRCTVTRAGRVVLYCQGGARRVTRKSKDGKKCMFSKRNLQKCNKKWFKERFHHWR